MSWQGQGPGPQQAGCGQPGTSPCWTWVSKQWSQEIPGWQQVRGVPLAWPPAGTAPGVLRPRAERCGHSHTPPTGPWKTPPAFGNWSLPPCTADPQSRVLLWPDPEVAVCPAACGEPGLAVPSWCLMPEWLLSESGLDSSQPGQRGPESFLPRAEPMEEGQQGRPLPKGVSGLHVGGKQTPSQTLGQPPHCPLGPLAWSPAQLPGLQGRAESGRHVSGLSVSCLLNNRGFPCHGDGVCPLRGHSQLWGVRAVHPSLSESPFCVPAAPS